MPQKKKMGRPTDSPKGNPIHIRLDNNTKEILDAYCEQEGVTKAEGVRRGIRELESKIKR